MTSQKVDPNYLPKGVDADIALSQEALNSQKPMFKVCVGSESGAYFRIASNIMVPGQNVVNMVPVVTSGSREVIEKVSNGECDGGFVQGDSYWNYVEHHQTANLPFARVFTPFKEAIHLVCNASSSVDEIDDLSSKNQVYFPSKSGAAETWTNIVAENDEYAKIPSSLNNASLVVNSNEEAMLKVNQGKDACAVYVAVPGVTKMMRNVENGAKNSNVVLVEIDDSDLDETKDPSGNKVYTFGKLTDAKYPNLLRQAGIFGTSYYNDINTLYVNADFIISDKWKSGNEKAYGQLANDLIGMSSEITTIVRR